MFEVLSGGDNCLNIDDARARIPPEGMPSSVLPNLLIQTLVELCEANPSLYETNQDCAQVVDTCLAYFPENEGCKLYVRECGARKYTECVQNLTFDLCKNTNDRAEVNLESLRISNQMRDGCKAYSPRVACQTLERFKMLFRNWFRY
ncbi:uncharacterized protein LOC101863258 [Aplysia californica]|uniref:Uncharacterized protein LOC101863258 n=1 Tax=Aplysia californica TaxID=6500 RepID=A0ABM0ZY80_APLCA|nr:uncharacterized protein LOC101863258 [Aplysia californica]